MGKIKLMVEITSFDYDVSALTPQHQFKLQGPHGDVFFRVLGRVQDDPPITEGGPNVSRPSSSPPESDDGINIRDVIGPRCIIKEDGQKIYDMIHKPLKAGKTVTLDFGGVDQFAAPFFNFSIGQLLKDIKEKDLCRLLRIENLNETGRLVVERVIENAAKYHGDVNHRKIVDDVIADNAAKLMGEVGPVARTLADDIAQLNKTTN